MARPFLLLAALCASLMLGLDGDSPITRPLWRLSFVPPAATRPAPPARHSDR